MTTTRQRAVGLLDILEHDDPGDRTAAAVRAAKCYRACVASGLYPADALAWAWADAARGEVPEAGEFDARLFELVKGRKILTAFGVMAAWLTDPIALPTGTLVLSGQTGSGKNVAAIYASVHRGGAYWLASDGSEIALGDAPMLREFARVPFLVIDELGRETLIGPTLSRIVALITKRHDSRLPTMITTNLPEAAFKTRYGDQIHDRAKNSGGIHLLECGSRRRSGAEPRLSVINRNCRIADLVGHVYALTCTMPTNVSAAAIDKLAAEYSITDAEIELAVERRGHAFRIPDGLSFGPIGRALRVAAGEETPAKERKHDR